PGPGDPGVSDPLEDGSLAHPFDSIQEAIDAAGEGDTVWVEMGTYNENISLNGTNITLTSTDPDDATVMEGTVIQGDGTSSVVTFSGSEGVNCVITGFTITGGNTSNQGGGIKGNGTTATISLCQVIGNVTALAGGGIHGCDGLISHCIISSNVGNNGGGLATCGGRIINCLISDNHALNRGGAVQNCDVEIINCTITDNSADSEGVLAGCDGTVSNCIVWGNNPATIYNSTAVFSYSCLEWVDLGTGNINKDPNFAFIDEYYIMPGSPCIDAGDNTAVPTGVVTDLDGEARFFDDPESSDTGNGTPPIVDMGAYEYKQTPRIALLPLEFEIFAFEGDSNPEDQNLFIRNCSGGVLNWQISESCSWLTADPCEGSSWGEVDEIALIIDVTGLARGIYGCELTIFDPCAVNSPQAVEVILRIIPDDEYLWVPYEYNTIQAAIDASENGDCVMAADGIYTGKGNRDIDFKGKAITVRSDNGPDNCIIDANGTSGDQHRGFYFHTGEGSNSILEGFTITDGYGPEENVGGYLRSVGGAIFCSNSSPRIINCIITDNRSGYGGGGIMCMDNSCPTIDKCQVINNIANKFGGGIFCYDNSNATISNCLLRGNIISGTSYSGGGGICCHVSHLMIINCLFLENLANDGGGIRNALSNTRLINCIFRSNTARVYGGGFYDSNTGIQNFAMMFNCTFNGNTAGQNGGGVYCGNSKIKIFNSIVWGNTPEEIYPNQSYTIVQYSNVQGGWTGEGNINQDPVFFDTDNGNYHLCPSSPCIEAGTNTPDGGLPLTDFEGNNRMIDGDEDGQVVVDMGAYEYVPEPWISYLPEEIEFYAVEAEGNPEDQVLTISNGGYGELNWDIIYDCNWLEVNPPDGSSTGEPNEVVLRVDRTGMPWGTYNCELTISDPCAANNPQVVEVFLYIYHELLVPLEYGNIQAAINAAHKHDVIIVADGIYRGVGNRDINFKGKKITVRSATGAENCIIDCEGTETERHRGFVFKNGENNYSRLDGFTIINGYAPEEIIDGEAHSAGGAIFCQDSGPMIINCIIAGNYSPYWTGGVFCIDTSGLILSNCTINSNEALSGGGIYSRRSNNLTLKNCIISQNVSTGNGGGIHFNENDNISITNCVLSGNRAFWGGGIKIRDSITTITNCTFRSNRAEYYGGGIHISSNAYVVIGNSIIWDNPPDEIKLYGELSITYSNIQGGWGGNGNIDVDPQFAGGGDFHLTAGSPCIDAGKNNKVPPDIITDIDGDPRFYDDPCTVDTGKGTAPIVDMGAYEYNQSLTLSVWPGEIEFTALGGGADPASQILSIRNGGAGVLNWKIDESCSWLRADPCEGSSTGEVDEVALSVCTSGLELGIHNCEMTVWDPCAINDPLTVQVYLYVIPEYGYIWVPYRYSTIQTAIDAAEEGDTIKVAPGVYIENIDFDGKNIVLTSTKPEDPAVVAGTVIQGDGTWSVVDFSGSEDASCEITGFTITGGNSVNYGGGILGNGTTATISQCQVIGNTSAEPGGGIHGCDGLISRCIISGNSGKHGGGAAACGGTIVNCLISDNHATNYGGGLNNCDGDIINCTITDNSADIDGVLA
ncbi:right-handed parallel beta-helix repeat-containing protein, partial [Planctomycetota bacterium]